MTKKKNYNLSNIPDELREIFINSNDQLKKSYEVRSLVDFSFFSMNVFSIDFDDSTKNKTATDAKQLLYELFKNDKQYVDGKLSKFETAYEETNLQVLYSLGIVYFWTNLESFVKRIISFLIKFDKDLLSAKQFKKIQIPMSEFYGFEEDEKAEYLTNLIIENLTCGKKFGAYRFECFLEPFGLNGKLINNMDKNLVAVHQLRNCIVHNDSIADSKLIEACGWMKYSVGDKISISRSQIDQYEKAVMGYQALVFLRINKMLGAPASTLRSIQKTIDDNFGRTL